MTTNLDIVTALNFLRPNASWSLGGDDYATLDWFDAVQTKPTQTEIMNAIPTAQAAQAAELQRRTGIRADSLRAAMLNRLTTATDAQIDTYVAANVTNLAQAQTAIGTILKLIALDSRG